MTTFDSWYKDNSDLMESHNIEEHVAEMIWHSARISVLHEVATQIQNGSIKIKLDFS